jgi:hypothetical protein
MIDNRVEAVAFHRIRLQPAPAKRNAFLTVKTTVKTHFDHSETL